MKTYTTKDLTTLFGFSREYLRQIRGGWHKVKLTENTDWQWVKGNIVYFQSAITKIKQHKEKK